MISQTIIDEVRERSNLVEIASQYFQLKKTGKNYKALCPFHTEKTPSFIINPQKQIFHCFGCGVGGNVFNLVMKLENMSFIEALKILAQKAGVVIPNTVSLEEESKIKEKEKLYEINESAASFYQYFLSETNEGKKAYNYLIQRGIKKETIQKFRLGYASGRENSLGKKVREKGFSFDSWVKASLLKKGSGKYFDYFRERIIFPIFNSQGKIVGFGGRGLDNTTLPKYLNSAGTAIFNKGSTLYGLNFAKDEVRSQGRIIIVEGYMDVLSTHQAGIGNVVASLGTSLTEEQVRILARYVQEVIVAYDSDTAGQSATLRGLDLLVERGIKVKVLSLPEGEDPDSLLKKKNAETFLKMVNSSYTLPEYRFDLAFSKFDCSLTEGKVGISDELIPFLAKIENPIEQSDYLKKLAEMLKIEERLILEKFNKFKKKKGSLTSSLFKNISLKPAYELAEANLIQMMLEDREIIPDIKEELSWEDFTNQNYREIVKEIFNLFEKGEVVEYKRIIDLVSEDIGQVISQLAFSKKEMPYNKNEVKIVKDYVGKIKERILKKEMEKLQEEIKKVEKIGKVAELNNLLIQYQKLSGGVTI